jgi:CheY-like chemotaxis protein
MARIFSVSYDLTLLRTRELLLENMGHTVVSAEGFAHAFELCGTGTEQFDLIVLGHSIPQADQQAIIRHCKATCPCPVLALIRSNEPPVAAASRSVESSDTREFISAVKQIVGTARRS